MSRFEDCRDVGTAVLYYRGAGRFKKNFATGVSQKKSISSISISSRLEDRIHWVVVRDSFRHRLVQPVDRVEPEDPGLARIVGAGTVGDDDPVVGDVRALRGGVEVVRDQPGVLPRPSSSWCRPRRSTTRRRSGRP